MSIFKMNNTGILETKWKALRKQSTVSSNYFIMRKYSVFQNSQGKSPGNHSDFHVELIEVNDLK